MASEQKQSLKERLIKNSTIKDTALLTESKIFGKKDLIPTRVPMINVAFSGKVDGGLTPGLTVIAGPSKHFKTSFALLTAAAFIQKYPEGVILFYDSEFGTPASYVTSFSIPPEQIVHTPITDIEMFKHDLMTQVKELSRDDKVFFLVDSVGNLASKKEIEDALEGKEKADFTRAKSLKSLFRMVTPHLTIKDFPMVVINHTYKTMEMYSRDIVSGGTGIYYSADNIWIVGRQQEKDGKELLGYNFVINVEKSRFVKEKSKIPISVSFEGGIQAWSGMLDNALEAGLVVKPKPGWYRRNIEPLDEQKSYREADIVNSGVFWREVFSTTNFADFIREKYELPTGAILKDEDVADDPNAT